MRLAILALLLAVSSFGADLWPFGGSGGNATKIRGVNVKASLGCTNGQILKYVSANSQFECADDSGGSGAGDVEGGTNLTTAGAIPYVSSSGTLNQDTPALHWDATNNRLGLGTASPDQKLDVRSGQIIVSNVFGYNFRNAAGNADGAIYENSDNSLRFYLNGLDRWTLTGAGSTGIGPSNTSPTGTLHVYDATATTGVTTLTVRAGAGQSSTNLFAFLDSAGSTIARFSGSGNLIFENTLGVSMQSGGNFNASSTGQLRFSSSADATSGYDSGLARSSANNLGVTNGSSTTYWTLGAGGILAGTDNSIDIGASGANRPRSLYLASNIVFGGDTAGSSSSLFYWTGRTIMSSPADGSIRLTNSSQNGFGLLQFGGTTSSFPALKRNSTALSARLADDSADAPVSASLFRTCQTEADGCWQFTVSGSDMILQYRTGGSWVTKATWAP